MRAALLLALSACCDVSEPPIDEPPAPLPRVRVAPSDGDARREFLHGARAWHALGFRIEYESAGLPACSVGWHEDAERVECQLTIIVERAPLDEAVVDRARRAVVLPDALLDSPDVERVAMAVAHGVGHVLLDTDEHTARGVMSDAVPRDLVLSDDDLDLACRAIGACAIGSMRK